MKIKNKEVLTELQLATIDTIWRMTRDELWALSDELFVHVPDHIDNLKDFYGDDLWNEIQKRSDQIFAEAEKVRNATVEVDGVVYPTVTFFDFYHLGWECDSKAWIVTKDGKDALVLTNHGDPYFPEDGIGTLQKKIAELNKNIKAMKTAVTQLELNG